MHFGERANRFVWFRRVFSLWLCLLVRGGRNTHQHTNEEAPAPRARCRMMLMLIAHALPTAAPQMHRFTVHQGYIPVGADVANGTMSIEQAKQWCSTLASCEGITPSRAT